MDPTPDPWKNGSDSSAAPPWGEKKRRSNGTDLGPHLELLTVKQFDHRIAEPYQQPIRAKAIMRPAVVQVGQVHGDFSGTPVEYLSEDVAHWQHFWNLYNDRELDKDKGLQTFHNASAYEKFGKVFMAHWPHHLS